MWEYSWAGMNGQHRRWGISGVADLHFGVYGFLQSSFKASVLSIQNLNIVVREKVSLILQK